MMDVMNSKEVQALFDLYLFHDSAVLELLVYDQFSNPAVFAKHTTEGCDSIRKEDINIKIYYPIGRISAGIHGVQLWEYRFSHYKE